MYIMLTEKSPNVMIYASGAQMFTNSIANNDLRKLKIKEPTV